MDLRKLKTLIELVETSGIAELEIQEGEERVRITRATASAAQSVTVQTAQHAAAATPPVALPATGATAETPPAEPEGHHVKSQMVGTFYRSATPGSKPFVEIGDTVEEGATLCIIEAMKLMNEIEAEVEGKIAEIYVLNATPVEFGEKLFRIETA